MNKDNRAVAMEVGNRLWMCNNSPIESISPENECRWNDQILELYEKRRSNSPLFFCRMVFKYLGFEAFLN